MGECFAFAPLGAVIAFQCGTTESTDENKITTRQKITIYSLLNVTSALIIKKKKQDHAYSFPLKR